MGCCVATHVDFLAATSTFELANMMIRQKESIKIDIEHLSSGNEEKISFLMKVCEDTDYYSKLIKDCDFKDNFSQLKQIVFNLFLSVKKNDQYQHHEEKKNLDNLLNHYNILEL